MAKERGPQKRNGGKVVGTIGGVGVVGVLLLYLLGGRGAGFGGGGFGFLPGSGTGSGNGETSIEAAQSGEASSAAAASSSESVSSESVSSEVSSEASSESVSESAGNAEEGIPDVIIVKISEDKVTINGNEVADAEALKEKIQEYNTDGRTFELQEDHAILETYNWVKACFDEMEVFLTEP